MGKVWDVLAPRNLELGPLAAGKGEKVELFDRDAERSAYTRPARNLAAIYLNGIDPFPGAAEPRMRVNLRPGAGDAGLGTVHPEVDTDTVPTEPSMDRAAHAPAAAEDMETVLAKLEPRWIRYGPFTLERELRDACRRLTGFDGADTDTDSDYLRAWYAPPALAELLRRLAVCGEEPQAAALRNALRITISGVAAGMRNTG